MSDREAMKLAYGLLWLDGEPSKNGLKFAARLALRECLSKEERKEAIGFAVDNHYNRPEDEKARDAALHKLFSIEPAFVEHEAPEDSFIRDAENACPVCGGSGHKDDITPEAIAELVKPLEWNDLGDNKLRSGPYSITLRGDGKYRVRFRKKVICDAVNDLRRAKSIANERNISRVLHLLTIKEGE